MRRLLGPLVLVVVGGCIVPRSVGFGQTATGLAPGATEAGISPGAGFVAANAVATPAAGGGTAVTTTRELAAPGFEGNFAIGLLEELGLNFHLSSAGLQPGLKISFPSDGVSVAVLPSVGVGYASQAASIQLTKGSLTSASDAGGTGFLQAMAGAKLIVSVPAGFYAGVGYDFQRLSSEVLAAAPTGKGTVMTSHAFSAAAGWELGRGALRVRPEIAVMVVPFINRWTVVGAASTFSEGGTELVVFPNLTFALGERKVAHSPPAQPEGLRPDELSMPPVFNAPPP